MARTIFERRRLFHYISSRPPRQPHSFELINKTHSCTAFADRTLISAIPTAPIKEKTSEHPIASVYHLVFFFFFTFPIVSFSFFRIHLTTTHPNQNKDVLRWHDSVRQKMKAEVSWANMI